MKLARVLDASGTYIAAGGAAVFAGLAARAFVSGNTGDLKVCTLLAIIGALIAIWQPMKEER
jgi:uncharacterized membrane protein